MRTECKMVIFLLSLCIALFSAQYSSKAVETLTVDGSTTVGPVAEAFATYYMDRNPDVEITISMSGSGNGAKSLIQNACDIAIMSRFMQPSEYEKAVENGVYPIPHMVALDGVAVAVNRTNPVTQLTLKELRDIYSGEITNWQEVGGPDKEIVTISRDSSSGTYEVFSELVMDEASIRNSEYVQSNGAMRSRIKSTPAAIGYVGLAFKENLKAVVINDVEPTMKAVSSGAYPLARPLFFWTDGYPEIGSHKFRYVMLYQSETGKEIVEDLGLVPVGL